MIHTVMASSSITYYLISSVKHFCYIHATYTRFFFYYIDELLFLIEDIEKLDIYFYFFIFNN